MRSDVTVLDTVEEASGAGAPHVATSETWLCFALLLFTLGRGRTEIAIFNLLLCESNRRLATGSRLLQYPFLSASGAK